MKSRNYGHQNQSVIEGLNKITIIMKRLNILFLVLFSFTFFNASANGIETSNSEMTYIKIGVDGMACPFCAYGLEKKIKKIKGAENLYIDINEGFITFAVPSDKKPSEEELKKIIKEAGFKVREIDFSLTPFESDINKK
jgi:copper chaperone CopZ